MLSEISHWTLGLSIDTIRINAYKIACWVVLNIGIIHGFFHALRFAGSRGSCLNTRPLGRVFKHRLRKPASVNAIKQTCVIVILACFTWIQHTPRWKRRLNIKYPFSYNWFLKTKWRQRQVSNVIASPHRHIYANESIGEMTSHGRNAFPCNAMHTNQGPVYACSSKSHVQTARESHDLNTRISWFEHGFCGFKQLRVTNSHARI